MTWPTSFLLSLLPGHLKRKKTSQWLWHFSVNWQVEFGQNLEIDSGATTCLWALQSLLGKVEVFGTQVFGGIRRNLFVEVNYQIAFTSMKLPKKPWTTREKYILKYNHTQVNTRQLQRKLQLDSNIGIKCVSYEWSLVKVHTFFPSILKLVFSIFQLSGRNPFSGHSHISIQAKWESERDSECEAERERERESCTSDNPLAWKWAPEANKFREKITVLRVCVNMHVKR